MELGDTRKRKQPNIMVALAPLITVIVLLVCCQLFLNIRNPFSFVVGNDCRGTYWCVLFGISLA